MPLTNKKTGLSISEEATMQPTDKQLAEEIHWAAMELAGTLKHCADYTQRFSEAAEQTLNKSMNGINKQIQTTLSSEAQTMNEALIETVKQTLQTEMKVLAAEAAVKFDNYCREIVREHVENFDREITCRLNYFTKTKKKRSDEQ